MNRRERDTADAGAGSAIGSGYAFTAVTESL